MAVDVGTLAGRIEFEDHVSATMEAVLKKVTGLESGFGGLNTSVKSVAGGFVLGEVAMKAFGFALDLTTDLIRDFTTEGASIASVEENFNRLTEGAGRAGETMLGVLREGTHNTIDDFTLIKTVNDQFAAGIQLTDEQMKTLAEGGFALAQAKGIEVADAFDTLNTAMLTGQVRAVQQLTGKIDLAKAEEEYAKSLGTTTDRLTALEKQEASRLGILKAVSAATDRLGEQTDGVAEIIAQLTTSWENFYDGLTSGVAASPHVVDAFLSVRDSLVETFGDSGTLLETFLKGVDNTADFIAEWAPVVIGWLGKVRDVAVDLWDAAVQAWEDNGAELMFAFGIIKDLAVGAYEAVLETWGQLPDWLKDAQLLFLGVGVALAALGPALTIALGLATALYAVLQVGKWEPISDFFFELGLELQGFTQAEQDAIIASEKAATAQAEQAKAAQEAADAQAKANETQVELNDTTEKLTSSFTKQNAVVTETAERTKEYQLAWEALNRLGTTYQDTLNGVNENLRASVIEYAKLGASVEDLFQAFPQLTKAQAEAAVASVEAAREIRAVQLETFEIIAGAHGDNINDWIEGEQRKLAVTLESLKIQGQLTDEMLNAQMAKFDAVIDAEISKRNESNNQSRDFYEKQVDDAQNAYDLIMRDSTRYTEQEVRESARLLEQRKRDLEHWTSVANGAVTEQTEVVERSVTKQIEVVSRLGSVWEDTVGRAIQQSTEMVRTLSGEVMSLAEFQEKQRQGGTFDIQPLTKTELKNLKSQAPSWVDDDEYLKQVLSGLEDREGTYAPRSATDYNNMIKDQVLLSQLRQYFDSKPEVSTDVPGFSESTYGGLSTTAQETVRKATGGSAGVSFSNTFNVNGTGQDVANVVSEELMRQLKTGRQFGAV